LFAAIVGAVFSSIRTASAIAKTFRYEWIELHMVAPPSVVSIVAEESELVSLDPLGLDLIGITHKHLRIVTGQLVPVSVTRGLGNTYL